MSAARSGHDRGTEHPIEMSGVSLGPSPGSGARIGMIALASGLTGEAEMHRILPPDETLLLTTRVADRDAVTLDNLVSIEADLARAAATIVPGGKLDVVVYCCTAGAMALGDGVVAERIRSVHRDVEVTTPYAAALAAFAALRVRSISLLTPYTGSVTMSILARLSRDGIEVARCRAFGIELTSEICRVTPRTIAEAALAVDHPASDAVFICCGGLRAAPVIEEIEASLGKPVVSSNQALAWHALRLARFERPVPGFGRLLRTGLATGEAPDA